MRVPTCVAAPSMVLAIKSKAEGETIIECGSSDGRAYYLASPLIPEAEAGWSNDDIPDGKIALTAGDGDEIDLLLMDSVGLKSARSYGATIAPIGIGESTVTVMVRYSSAVLEVYSFNLVNRSVYWTQHKMEQAVSKVAAF